MHKDIKKKIKIGVVLTLLVAVLVLSIHSPMKIERLMAQMQSESSEETTEQILAVEGENQETTFQTDASESLEIESELGIKSLEIEMTEPVEPETNSPELEEGTVGQEGLSESEEKALESEENKSESEEKTLESEEQSSDSEEKASEPEEPSSESEQKPLKPEEKPLELEEEEKKNTEQGQKPLKPEVEYKEKEEKPTEEGIKELTEAEKEAKKEYDLKKANKNSNINKDMTEEYEVLQGVVKDNHAEAVYEERTYNPSEKFISQAEKIKYNADMPLENIPAFITQEMIIGALKCQDEYNIPASVTIAQIIQESGFGKYGPNGENGQGLSYLAFQYNNLFGIKGMGTAGSVDMRTHEQTAFGENYRITAGFRIYNTYTESIEDRAWLLQGVYKDLIEGVTDANTFAVRIARRWATDTRYAEHLIWQMQKYDLYCLDKMSLNDFSELLGEFAHPCPGAQVTSIFGRREWNSSFHKGIDFGTGSTNIPTYAVKEGIVVTSGWSESAGNWIIIDHGNGIVTKYMHHSSVYVSEGEHVQIGQQIGLTGNTGNSTGNHLHFQLEIDGNAIDPASYLWSEQSGEENNTLITKESIHRNIGEGRLLKRLEKLIQEEE